MDSKAYTKAFATLLEQFVSQLKLAFPEEKQLHSYHRILSALLKTNPGIVVRGFKKFAIPHKEEILSRNESYFLAKDFTQECEDASVDIVTSIRLKELWKVMSDDTKSVTWQYLCNLVTIASKL